MSLAKHMASIELDDGTTVEDVRVVWADRVKFSQMARANRWKDDDPVKQTEVMAWAAAQRTGGIPADLGYPEFSSRIVWVAIDQVDPAAPDDPADPTQPEASGTP